MFRPCSPDPEAKILEPVIVILPKVVNDSTINNNTQEKRNTVSIRDAPSATAGLYLGFRVFSRYFGIDAGPGSEP